MSEWSLSRIRVKYSGQKGLSGNCSESIKLFFALGESFHLLSVLLVLTPDFGLARSKIPPDRRQIDGRVCFNGRRLIHRLCLELRRSVLMEPRAKEEKHLSQSRIGAFGLGGFIKVLTGLLSSSFWGACSLTHYWKCSFYVPVLFTELSVPQS